MKDRLKNNIQNFSRAIIQPVMFMAVIGIIIAFSFIFMLDFMPMFLQVAGNFVFELMMEVGIKQLPVIFTVGLSVSLAKKKKGDAAILGIIVYLMFIVSNNLYLKQTGMLIDQAVLSGSGQALVLGMQVVDMGVFLGIILGSLTGYFFNRYCDTKFPKYISIYGGSRFVFVIMVFVTIGVSIISAHVWPFISQFIANSTLVINKMGSMGVFLYGFLNRFLIPAGLHHLIYMPFFYSPLGGTLQVGSELIQGAGPIMIYQMGNAATLVTLHESSKWMLFGFSKVFGTVGISMALIKTAYPINKLRVKGMIIPLALVAILSGITEPFEFIFLFISPLLWLIHSLLDGFGQFIIYVLGGQLPMNNGIIEAFPILITIPMQLTKPLITVAVGSVFTFVWYFVFKTLILKLDIKTPGRDVLQVSSDQSPGESDNVLKSLSNVQIIIDGLGGAKNIESITNCMTRLRVEIKDESLINVKKLDEFQHLGIVESGNNIQIIIGLHVTDVRENIAKIINIE